MLIPSCLKENFKRKGSWGSDFFENPEGSASSRRSAEERMLMETFNSLETQKVYFWVSGFFSET